MKKTTFIILFILSLTSCNSLKFNRKIITSKNITSINKLSIINHKPDVETKDSKKSNQNTKKSKGSNHDETSSSLQEPSKSTLPMKEVTTPPINNPPMPKTKPTPTPQITVDIEESRSEEKAMSPAIPPAVPEPLKPPIEPKIECPNALYDVNQSCNWIHPNLRPVDELGRVVPIFKNSQEAWDWGEAQMMESTSKSYLCGCNRMDGETNDGTPFYYAYMKSCPLE